MGSVSGSFFSRAVGRSLICQIKAGAQGLGGLLGALDLYSFVMEGGEREELDLIGRRVLAERRTASKIPLSCSWLISWKRKCREDEEREANILRVMWKTNKALHRTCTTHEGTGCPLKEVLNVLGRKVSSAGFQAPKSWPWKRRRNLNNPPGFRHQKM